MWVRLSWRAHNDKTKMLPQDIYKYLVEDRLSLTELAK